MLVDASAGTWSQLTADHRIANSSSERQRLQERGHTVKKRLYGLNISRMLGDRWGAGEGGDMGLGGDGRVYRSLPFLSPAQAMQQEIAS